MQAEPDLGNLALLAGMQYRHRWRELQIGYQLEPSANSVLKRGISGEITFSYTTTWQAAIA